MRKILFWMMAAGVVVACTNDFDKFTFKQPTGGGGSTVASTGGAPIGGAAGMASSSTGMGECTTPQDCGFSTQCLQKNCILPAGTCVDIIPTIGTPCNDMGGNVCDGQGNCVECVDGMQCASMICDMATNTCVSANCTDTVVNGDETDVDCGGSCPADCANNQNCNLAADCQSGFCDTSMGPCGTGGAGGAGGGPMVAGCCQPCGSDLDCTNQTWCDNMVCVPKKADGQPCMGGNECTSTFCVDGFCCQSSCTQLCAACSMAKTGQADGTCAGVTVATDPDNECVSTPANCRTGDCSGTIGQCEFVANGTLCNDGMFCTATDQCNSLGVCNGTGNPCPGQNAPPSCDDSCDEGADNCTLSDMSGTSCDEDSDTVFGLCDSAGTCVGD
jgi:hypothetical protein